MKTTVVFKEWAPDQADLGVDSLIDATNLLPKNGAYEPFRPLNVYAETASSVVIGAFGSAELFNIASYSYYGTPTALFFEVGAIVTDVSGTAYSGSTTSAWAFTQYQDLVIAANSHDNLQFHTAGSSATNFSDLAAIKPRRVGVVNQFVIAGDFPVLSGGPSYIRWSAIDDPSNWPTPNSATAIATQAGEQYFSQDSGPVTGIYGGDQYGLIFQRNAITRMTYVGPPVVFQFDTLTKNFGASYPFSIVGYKGMVYFAGDSGICATDGVTVLEIGKGKVNDFFLNNVVGRNLVRAACDEANGLIYFAFPTNSLVTYASSIIIYNVAENRFSFADEDVSGLHSVPKTADGNSKYLRGWNVARRLCDFSGTPGTALITTNDAEFNPGGRTWVDGVKPNVEASSAPTIGVRVGYRDSLSSSPTYTSTTGATSSTGFADIRVDAKYVRTEISITGDFSKTTGFVLSSRPSSGR